MPLLGYRKSLRCQKADYGRIPACSGFPCHGVEDDKIFVDLGRDATRCLGALGVEVYWNENEGLGHWHSKDTLNDLKILLNITFGQGRRLEGVVETGVKWTKSFVREDSSNEKVQIKRVQVKTGVQVKSLQVKRVCRFERIETRR